MIDASDLRARYGHCIPTVAQLQRDLCAACASLGELSDEWTARGQFRDSDFLGVERTLSAMHLLLIALRAQGDTDAA